MDVLTDLLERSRARGVAFALSTAHGNWGVGLPPAPGLAVHVIVDGEARLWTDDPVEALWLLPGDVVLVRGDVAHQLGHSVGAPWRPVSELIDAGPEPGTSRDYVLGKPDSQPPAVFLCGAYAFDGDLCDGLLRALPDSIHLRPASGSALRMTIDLLAREAVGDDPGQQTLLDRLLDVVLIDVLREHFAAQGAAAPAWFRASVDPGVGAALRALHGDPVRPWTVADLAHAALLSRAAFARRFTALLGEAPLTYLTGWRMALARERLRDSDDGLAAVARSVGYASEFSFAAAFKRQHGQAPGRWRTEARTERPPLPEPVAG